MDRPPVPEEARPPGFSDDLYCFVCGPENPVGLRLAFSYDTAARTSRAEWVPAREHQGWTGVVHGGIVAAVLDEAMVNLAIACGLRAVTAEMTVRLARAARVGARHEVTGRIVEARGRIVRAEATLSDGAGVVARARGTLLRPAAR